MWAHQKVLTLCGQKCIFCYTATVCLGLLLISPCFLWKAAIAMETKDLELNLWFPWRLWPQSNFFFNMLLDFLELYTQKCSENYIWRMIFLNLFIFILCFGPFAFTCASVWRNKRPLQSTLICSCVLGSYVLDMYSWKFILAVNRSMRYGSSAIGTGRSC